MLDKTVLKRIATGDRENWTAVYREYYEGQHSTQLTDRQRRYLQLKIGEEFRANYCPIVVDSLAERLVVTGIGAPAEQAIPLWDWWKANRMDHWQGVVHTSATRDGDCYILVSWDNATERPVFTFEPAFDGVEGVKCFYAAEARGEPVGAFKRWEDDDGRQRLNLYYPERIEKWQRRSPSDDPQSGYWEQYHEVAGDPWPILWRTGQLLDGEPLGVPVIHFRNRDRGYNYGASELQDVVPMQNALNKAIIDLVAAGDTTAFRIYWMLGDDPSALDVQPGSWIYSTKPPGGEDGVAIGCIDGEDLRPLINFKDQFAMEIARISRTPISYFQISGHRPAEGTLKQEESGLVAKAKNRQVSFGNSWENVFSMARRLWNTFGDTETAQLGTQIIGELDESVKLETIWQDAESRNEKVLLETLKLKAELGIPSATLWAEMGYSPEQIAKMLAERGAELQSTANVGGELLRAFERGV